MTSTQIELRTVLAGAMPTPAPGATARLEAHLRNGGDKAIRVPLFDTLRAELRRPDGTIQIADGARDMTRPGTALTEPIAPGSSCVVTRAATLSNGRRGVTLLGDDGFGGSWFFEQMVPGSYAIRFRLKTDANRLQTPASDEPVWQGEAVSEFCEFTLEGR